MLNFSFLLFYRCSVSFVILFYYFVYLFIYFKRSSLLGRTEGCWFVGEIGLSKGCGAFEKRSGTALDMCSLMHVERPDTN